MNKDTKRTIYLLIANWLILFFVIILFKELKSSNAQILVFKSALKTLLAAAILYLVIYTILAKTYVSSGAFYYTGFGINLALSVALIGLTGKYLSPFIFLLFISILFINLFSRNRKIEASASVLIILVYLSLFFEKPYLIFDAKYLINLIILILIGTASYFSKTDPNIESKHNPPLANLETLEKAYGVSRQQSQQREKAQQDLVDTTQKLITLIDVARSMGVTQRLNELLELIVNKAQEILNTKISFLMLKTEDEFKVAYSIGLSDITKEIFSTKAGEGFFGEIVANKKVVSISEKDNDPRLSQLAGSLETIRNILCVPLVSPDDREVIGILGAANLLMLDTFTEEHQNYLMALAIDAVISLKNRLLFNKLEKSYGELDKSYDKIEKSYLEMIQALSQTIEARDPYTYGHVDRVREYAVAIGRELGLSKEDIELIKSASILHDVGKLGTPDKILLKPDSLTAEERLIMNNHVIKSVEILRGITTLDTKVLDWIKHHHERYDGEGYPDGLKGDGIPLGAQIIAIADTFDAMTSDRPYRKAFPTGKAMGILQEVSGVQFNPKVVEAFLEVFKKETLSVKA